MDLLDNMVACYRVPYRKKKWWFNIYAWSLSVSAVNAWRLRRQITGNREPFLPFLRNLVVELFGQYGTRPIRQRVSFGPTAEARFDRQDHWIVSTEDDGRGAPKRRNCKQCSNEGKPDRKTLLMCEKCGVPLHHHCFKETNFLPLIFLKNFLSKCCSKFFLSQLFLNLFPSKCFSTFMIVLL